MPINNRKDHLLQRAANQRMSRIAHNLIRFVGLAGSVTCLVITVYALASGRGFYDENTALTVFLFFGASIFIARHG